MAVTLPQGDWERLLKRISKSRCTPFLGAGASTHRLPLAGQIAERWAQKHGYPLGDFSNLARVAQFRVLKDGDAMEAKEDIAELCVHVQPPDFASSDEIHGVLADLPLPIYITTNYDDFMLQALRNRRREARQELCRWNRYVRDNFDSVFKRRPTFEPSIATPLVYHLHGSKDMPQSLVLTEEDYLDFLVRMSQDSELLPAPVVRALAGTSLLFIGYSLMDWDLLVLFRSLFASMGATLGMSGVAVQLDPLPLDASEETRARARWFLNLRFEKILPGISVNVYWGSASEFAAELRSRWEAFCHAPSTG